MAVGTLEPVVKAIAQMKLPRVKGFAVNEANGAFLLGLVEGAWVTNATLSKERREVADQIIEDLVQKVLPVLERHVPGKEWTVRWEKDSDAYFEGRSTVLSFRWSE